MPTTFDDLKIIIRHNDHLALARCIETNPELLFAKDEEEQSVLSFALRFGHFQIVDLLLKKLKSQGEDRFTEVILSHDKNAWTPLHVAACYANYQMVKALVDALGANAHRAAITINHNFGNLPLKLVEQNSSPDKKAIKKLIKDITIERTHSDITAPIAIASVVDEYKNLDQNNLELMRNLRYGCFAATHIRQFILNTATHMNSNSLSKEDYSALRNKITKMRIEYTERDREKIIQDADERKLARLRLFEELVKKHEIGNCQEYAELVYFTLFKMGVKVNVDIITIYNGDHGFVVIGRKEGSDAAHYRDWGPNAVVVDAWQGAVFPASEMANKMRAYATYLNQKHIARAGLSMFFDPEYHVTRAEAAFTKSFLEKEHQDYSTFTQSEVAKLNDIEALFSEQAINKTLLSGPA